MADNSREALGTEARAPLVSFELRTGKSVVGFIAGVVVGGLSIGIVVWAVTRSGGGGGGTAACTMQTLTLNISDAFQELQVKSGITAMVITGSGRDPSVGPNSVTITACESTIKNVKTSVGESSNRVPIGHGSGPVQRLTLETTGPYAERSNATVYVSGPIGGIAVGDNSHVSIDKLGFDFGNAPETFIDATAGSTITVLGEYTSLSGTLQRLSVADSSVVSFAIPVDIPGRYGQAKCTGGGSILVQGNPITAYGCVAPSTLSSIVV